MLNWDEYNKDEAAVVQQEALAAKPVVQEAVAEVPEVKEEASNVEAGARAAQAAHPSKFTKVKTTITKASNILLKVSLSSPKKRALP
jgi:polygalacturonase